MSENEGTRKKKKSYAQMVCESNIFSIVSRSFKIADVLAVA